MPLLLNLLQATAIFAWTAFVVTICLVAIAIAAVFGSRTQIPLFLSKEIWSPVTLLMLGARLQVLRRPKLNPDQPLIFLANHTSMLDVPVTQIALDRYSYYIAKKELAWVPFVGWFIWGTGMIFVDRSNRANAMESLRKAAQKIRDGKSVLAYPEGTRSRTGELLPLKKGPFVLAIESKAPIVPMAIRGAGLIWPAHGIRFRPGVVRMIVGDPIPTDSYTPETKEALMERYRAEMEKLLREIDGAGRTDGAAPV